MKKTKILSWNVNGIRSVLKKGFLDFMEIEQPDMICLQEVRARPEQVDLELPGYHQYWNPGERPGYAGVSIFTKEKPLAIEKGLGVKKYDNEGRAITTEFPAFYLVSLYSPNARRDLSRLDYRLKWDRAMRSLIKRLARDKPVVLCGDLNVAHNEIDLANPRDNKGYHGFTDEERASFTALLKAGFIDTFREFNDEGGNYTWWSNRKGVRERNIGWRVDYFCISRELRPRLVSAEILNQVYGSDHCPTGIELKGV